MSMLKWFYILNKRLFKKTSYIVILILICAMTVSLSLFVKNDTALLKISVFSTDIQAFELFKGSDIDTQINFELYSDKEQAISSLTHGDTDSVWLFNSDLNDSVRNFVKNGKPIAEVIQREENVFLRLSREKLFGALYPLISREIYESFVAENYGDTKQEVLDEFFAKAHIDENIIDLKLENSGLDTAKLDHILGPVRGLLAIAVFICGFAGLLAYKKDILNGIYCNIPKKRLVFIKAANILLYSLNAGIISLISLALCGRLTILFTEVLHMMMLVISSVVFCLILSEVFDSFLVLSALLPVTALLMLAVCPVFINLRQFSGIGSLFPPFYYLFSFSDSRFLIYWIIYILISALLMIITKYLKFLCYGE